MRKDPLGLDVTPDAADELKAFAPDAQQAMQCAQGLAQQNGSATVESVHLLLGAMQSAAPDAQLRALVQLSGLKWDEVWLYAHSALDNRAALTDDAAMRWGASATPVLRTAGDEARRSESAQVGATHIFIACFRPQKTAGLAEVLAPLGSSIAQLRLHLRALRRGEAAVITEQQSPLSQLTVHGERALEAAHAQMRASFCGRISTLHLLLGVLENPDGDAIAALQTAMINVEALRERARAALSSDGEIAGAERKFMPAAKRALDRAKAAAREGGRSHIGNADLLLGLLPQRALWVERAQFGAHPDDPAAAVLADVDAELLRALLNGERVVKPAQEETKKQESASDARLKLFAIFFCVQIAIILSTEVFRFAKRNATEFAMLMITVLVGTALIACGMLVFSKNATRRANWQWAFIGAIAGMWAGITISNAM